MFSIFQAYYFLNEYNCVCACVCGTVWFLDTHNKHVKIFIWQPTVAV